MTYADRQVLVLGLGETGHAMACWLSRRGARVRVADSRADCPGADALRSACPAAELLCGSFSSDLLEGVSLVAISPGLTLNQPIIAEASRRGIEVVGEIELFAQALASPEIAQHGRVIAITGTNGKTTTTTLTGELVRAAGLDAAVAGNISPAALAELLRRLDAGRLPDVWVLELSSFQLETTRSLEPDAATVLNVTDDHLDRHGTMGEYAAIKRRIFLGSGVQVLNRDDPGVMAMRRDKQATMSFGLGRPTGPDEFGLIEHDGASWLARGTEPLMPRRELPLVGDHNVANALAALALCVAIDIPVPALLQGLRGFRGLPHRVERVGSRVDGVEYFDDSKGTNVGATLAALQGLGRPVVLIAGGDGKGQDFGPLADAFGKYARAVVLIGRDAALIRRQTESSGVDYLHAGDMQEAVVMAHRLAQPGDAVLLSPACASFDMFKNYAHRAQVFVDAVRRLDGVRA